MAADHGSADPATVQTPSAASAISGHLDTRTAATEVAHALHDSFGTGSDLAIIFASFHHRAALPEAVETIRQTITPSITMAVTAEAVLGVEEELEGVAGMSVLAMRMPGATLSPWITTPEKPIPLSRPEEAARRIHLTDDFRTAVLLAEPFSTPITRLLPALTECGQGQPVPIVGGMASGASMAGQNLLILDDKVMAAGAIGVSIAGDVAVDFVVSQGCRPIGTPLVITKVDKNMILELGGKPSLAALHEIASSMPETEREMLQQGLLIGHVIDEQRRPFGRGDFLVRSLLGLDRKRGGVVVGEIPRLGQTVQFHLRDAMTAEEDLQLLLDAQQLNEEPFGALLFSCNGRGKRLFGEESHDIRIINDRLAQTPIAGFFAAGEIGPIGDRSFLHGHTASMALFRPG